MEVWASWDCTRVACLEIHVSDQTIGTTNTTSLLPLENWRMDLNLIHNINTREIDNSGRIIR